MEDDLQMAWDTALVRAYFETPTKHMTGVVKDFLRKQNLHDFKDFFALDLKRCPKKLRWHWRCTVTRYVYAYLPNINKVLSAHGPSKMIDLIIAVNKSKNDTYASPQDKQKVYENHRMRKKATMLKAQATTSLREAYDLGEKYKLSGQWNVVK